MSIEITPYLTRSFGAEVRADGVSSFEESEPERPMDDRDYPLLICNWEQAQRLGHW